VQNDFDGWSIFPPPTPPWSLTYEVLKCHFHLNVNLRTVSLRLAWLLTCFASLFALDHIGYAELWAVVSLNQNTLFSFSSAFSKELRRLFFCSLLVQCFVSPLIFSWWQWLALRSMRENKPLMLFRLLRLCCDRSFNSIAYFLLIMQ